MAKRVGRNDPCPCGSGLKFKRCCLGREPAPPPIPELAGGERPGGDIGPSDLTFMIEMPGGGMIRRVPNASALQPGLGAGSAAEQATQDAATLWGLPDFVYRADLRRVGSGSRELGDRILLVGGQGIVVQVKCRAAISGDAEKERRWAEKQITKAIAQANGTIRALRMEAARLTNARGRRITVDAGSRRWLSVVVVDHASVPSGIVPNTTAAHVPCVVLTRRDWTFLFDQLKSTHAVGAYLERVAAEAIELGREPVRYFELAMADQQASPDPLDPALLGQGARHVSTPLLPLAPAGADDERAHRLLRSIMEDVAVSHIGDRDESDRLRVLAELDRLPVGHRAEIGRKLWESLNEVAKAPEGMTEWRFSRLGGGRDWLHLAFGACSSFSEAHRAAFSAWVQLRHHELLATRHDADAITVGILLTRRHDGRRPWDTTMVAASGELHLTQEELASYEQLWSPDPPEALGKSRAPR